MERTHAEKSTTGRLRRHLASLFNVREGRASFEEIRRRFVNGSRLDGPHLCILIVAMLIASIGLNTNSTEAIVGAMLICPLMGSVLAISYSVATLDRHTLGDALLGLAIQVAFCLATSTLYFVLTPLSYETNELLTNSTPTVWDVLIALAGGFAGGLGNSRNQEPTTLIAGVAVATALMPPLCAVGYYLSIRNIVQALSAFYEFALNVVFIAFAAEIVLLALRIPLCPAAAARADSERSVKRIRRTLIIATALFAVPCIFMTADMVRQAAATNDAATVSSMDTYETQLTAQELQAACPAVTEYHVGTEFVSGGDAPSQQVVATVEADRALTTGERQQIKNLIEIHVPQVKSINFIDGTDSES